MQFKSAFDALMAKRSPSFEVSGLLARDGRVYPFDTDTKVLSTIFEMLIRPFIYEIAQNHGLEVMEPRQQNYYPDFTLMSSRDDDRKIAVDVKTTYRSFRADGTWRARFTLGSFASYMRTESETKNIAFPFSDYSKHFIVGFIYTRSKLLDHKLYDLDNHHDAQCAFGDVAYFVQEKYRIAGDRPGSGNTENIGSIVASSLNEFEEGNGPFATLGEDTFVDYWRNFPRYRESGEYSNLAEYLKTRQG